MRKIIANHGGLSQRMEGIERKQLQTDTKIENIMNSISELI